MGEDKSLLPFSSSSSLIEFQYKRLEPYFKNIFISTKNDKFDFLQDKTKLIIDKNQDIYSPILALQTILEKFDKIFIIPVDTPFLTYQTINKIIDESNTFDITIAQTPLKTHNLCGIFSKEILAFIKNMLKDDIHRINYLIKNSKSQIINFYNEDEFLNLNDKLEYKKALQIIN